MPDIWTEPRTWIDGETPTGAQFNTQIRDNLSYLKNTPNFSGDISAVGDVNVGDDINVMGSAVVSEDLLVKGNTQLGDQPTDTVDIKAAIIGAPLRNYTETRTSPAITGGTLTLDCALGTYFKVALNADCNVVITNAPPTSRALGIMVIFTADGTLRSITWPASVVWPGGIAPTASIANLKRDVVALFTEDGGVTWFGVVVGQNY